MNQDIVNNEKNKTNMEIKADNLVEAVEAVARSVFSEKIKNEYLDQIKDEKKRKKAEESFPQKKEKFKKELGAFIEKKNINEKEKGRQDFSSGGFISYLSGLSIRGILKKIIINHFKNNKIEVTIEYNKSKTKNMSSNVNMSNSTPKTAGENSEIYDKGYGMIDDDDEEAMKDFKDEWKEKAEAKLEKSKKEGGVVFEYGKGRWKIDEKEAREFEIETLKNGMENAHKELIDAQRKFNQAKNEYGGFVKRMKSIFGDIFSGKEKRADRKEERSAVKEEFENAKEKLQASKERFAKFFEEYALALYEKNNQEIERNGEGAENIEKEKEEENLEEGVDKNENEVNERNKEEDGEKSNDLSKKMSFGAFLAGVKIFEISKKGKDKNGAEKEMTEKVSLINGYNAKLLELEKLKMESAEGVTKKLLKRAWAGFNAIPKNQRIAIGMAFAGTAAFASGGLSKVGSLGLNVILKMFGVGVISAGLTRKTGEFIQREDKRMMQEIERKYKEKQGGIFLEISKRNENIRKRNERDSKIIMGVALSSAVVSLGGSLLGDEISELISGGHNVEIPPVGDVASGEYPFGVPSEADIVGSGTEIPSADSTIENVSPLSDAESVPPVDAMPNLEKGVEGMKNLGKLGEGGNVWNVLKESGNFDGGDRQIVEALANYKKEIMDSLMENGDMSGADAQKYVEWRFRHMDAEDVVKLDGEGRIYIEGFDDKNYISKFENQSNEALVSSEKNMGDVDTEIKEKISPKAEFVVGNDNLVPEHIEGLDEEGVRFEHNFEKNNEAGSVLEGG